LKEIVQKRNIYSEAAIIAQELPDVPGGPVAHIGEKGKGGGGKALENRGE
jgi:hypothetical protein